MSTKVLRNPAMHTALTGPDQSIQPLCDWSQRQQDDLRICALTQPLRPPNGAPSPDCWAG